MNGTDEKWLFDHLLYDLSMLRHTIKRVTELPEGPDWNAQYEAFAVHARLLTSFLSNGERGNRNARQFVAGFQSKTTKVQEHIGRINRQVMHTASTRPSSAEGKLNTKGCIELFNWIERELSRFVELLPEGTRAKWKERASQTDVMIEVRDARPQATNALSATMTSVNTVLPGSKSR